MIFSSFFLDQKKNWRVGVQKLFLLRGRSNLNNIFFFFFIFFFLWGGSDIVLGGWSITACFDNLIHYYFLSSHPRLILGIRSLTRSLHDTKKWVFFKEGSKTACSNKIPNAFFLIVWIRSSTIVLPNTQKWEFYNGTETQAHTHTKIATLWLKQPRGPIQWNKKEKKIKLSCQFQGRG